MTLHIAALASGSGSNVMAIHKCIEAGLLDANIQLVLSNKPGAPVLEKARLAGLPVWAKPHEDFEERAAFDLAMLAAIEESGADTVVLAGYMRLLSREFVRAFAGRILNIHPALLPSFPGVHGGRDALDHGVRFSGATVHFVTEPMDSGPIIIQGVVPMTCNDNEESLMPRIHALEHRIYPQALQWLAEERLEAHGRCVHLKPSRVPTVAHASYGDSPLGPWMICPPLEAF